MHHEVYLSITSRIHCSYRRNPLCSTPLHSIIKGRVPGYPGKYPVPQTCTSEDSLSNFFHFDRTTNLQSQHPSYHGYAPFTHSQRPHSGTPLLRAANEWTSLLSRVYNTRHQRPNLRGSLTTFAGKKEISEHVERRTFGRFYELCSGHPHPKLDRVVRCSLVVCFQL